MYAVSFVAGLGLAVGSLGGFFSQIFTKREAVLTTAGFIIPPTDVFLPFVFLFFLYDPILGYLLRDPHPGLLFPSSSLISIYIMTGMLTGDVVFKSIFPLRVTLTSRRKNLRLTVEALEVRLGQAKKTLPSIHWFFEKRPDLVAPHSS